jgi:NADH dehydrogenase FAD-containing subunit
MLTICVVGGGYTGVELIAERQDFFESYSLHLYKLVGLRKQVQVALDWALARFFPRDSAIMRQPPRCAVCASHARSSCERDVA